MSKTTLQAVLPDGSIATRSTDNAYTHVVAVFNAPEEVVDYIAETNKSIVYAEGRVAEYMAAGGVYSVEAEKRNSNLPVADRQVSYYVRLIRIRKAQVTEMEAKASGFWTAVSWHSRQDLAAKAAAKLVWKTALVPVSGAKA